MKNRKYSNTEYLVRTGVLMTFFVFGIIICFMQPIMQLLFPDEVVDNSRVKLKTYNLKLNLILCLGALPLQSSLVVHLAVQCSHSCCLQDCLLQKICHEEDRCLSSGISTLFHQIRRRSHSEFKPGRQNDSSKEKLTNQTNNRFYKVWNNREQ